MSARRCPVIWVEGAEPCGAAVDANSNTCEKHLGLLYVTPPKARCVCSAELTPVQEFCICGRRNPDFKLEAKR